MLALYLAIIETESDKSKFSDIYISYREILYKCAYSVLQNEFDSEDAVHEVFLTLAKNFEIISKKNINGDDLKRYLITAVKNRAIDIIRKSGKRQIEYNDSIFDDDYSDDIIEQITTKDTCNAVLGIILSLDDKYLEVLYASLVLELSVGEIAKLSGLKKETVKKRLYRGKLIVKKEIEKRGIAI